MKLTSRPIFPLVVLLASLPFLSCRRSTTSPTSKTPVAPSSQAQVAPLFSLHLQPMTDLVQAASLTWLLEIHPRELVSHTRVLPAIETILPHARMVEFERRSGGVDPLTLDEFVMARYPSTTLVLARGAFSPKELENAFERRVGTIESRSISVTPSRESVARLAVKDEALVLFGSRAAALELGRPGPSRSAILFAEDKLKRSQPALRTELLSKASRALGDAPIRFFAPGPFEGEWAKGLGGLLGGTTTVAFAVRPTSRKSVTQTTEALKVDATIDGDVLEVRFVLLGEWQRKGDADSAATAHLREAFKSLQSSALGKRIGLDHALHEHSNEVEVQSSAEALFLTVAFDSRELANNLHTLIDAPNDLSQ